MKKLLFFLLCSMFVIKAYSQVGNLDQSFGAGGFVVPRVSGIFGIAVQADGKIITGGDGGGICRYNSDGSLDNSFDGDGVAAVTHQVKSVVIQADGKIIVAGNTDVGNWDFALTRFNRDGSLDLTFDGDGKQTTDFANSLDFGYSVALQPDGKIIVAGQTNTRNPSFALARYNQDGSLDNTFSEDGKQTTGFFSLGAGARSVAVQVDGKIVAAGYGTVNANNETHFMLARYNTDGSLDLTFDGDGKQTTSFGVRTNTCNSLAIQIDGKIVAAGDVQPFSATGFNTDFAIARFNPDGSLDNSFGNAGKVTTDFNFGNDPNAEINNGRSVVLQSDGKIIVSGDAGNRYESDFAIARYNTDGSLDNSFSDDGKQTANVFTHAAGDYGLCSAIYGDRVYVAYLTIAAFLLTSNPDSDGDGILDANDNCPNIANADQTNTDGDTQGDACDPDDDNDGVPDATDNCPLISNTNQLDTDADGLGNACDPDDDNDGIPDATDNCPLIANINELDTDADGSGNACDLDNDNDGIPDATDNCPLIANPSQANNDGDGQGDICDPDDDNDGVPDATDNCPLISNTNQLDTDDDGLGNACDPDDDNDRVPDANDNCPVTANANQADMDHDGVGDVCDDSDNDGIVDAIDNCPATANSNQADEDHDGQGDVCDKSCGNKNDKVRLCHNGHEICVSQNAVQAHLNHGDIIGPCPASPAPSQAAPSSLPQKDVMISKMKFGAYPNPSNRYFTLDVRSGNFNDKMNLKVFDNVGRVVEIRSVTANGTFQIGASYRPGIYYAELTQGKQKVTLKLIKQPN